MSKGTCFIVSPIGDADMTPEIRQHFEVIRRVVNTVCTNRILNLDPVSAVDIASNGDINEEILEHLREDVFCVINLDALNANVMYELGIRVQACKPFISIAPKGQSLPFDRISKRTLFFGDIYTNLQERDKFEDDLKQSIVTTLENYVSSEANPLPTTADIMSELSALRGTFRETLRETLREALQETNLVKDFANYASSVNTSDYEDVLSQLEPQQAIIYAIQNKHVKLLEQIVANYPEFANNEAVLHNGASLGSVIFASALKEKLPQIITDNDVDGAIEILGALVSCYLHNDLESLEKDFVDDVINKLFKIDLTNKQKALILCQKERLYHGAGYIDDAISLCEQVVSLDDEDGAYFYNYGLLLLQRNKDGDLANAINVAKKMLSLDKNENEVDVDHLKMAYKALLRSEKAEDKLKADEVLLQIQKISPLQAKMAKM